MKTLQLLLIITGILFSSTSFSQENYLPGFIVTVQQDTVKGFIDYRNWRKNPNKIHFKNKLADTKTTYTTTDIYIFGVHDEIYVSAIIETEVSPNTTNQLSTSQALNIKMDTTFLQTIIDGPKSLFYYNLNDIKSQFYIKRGNRFELLIHKKYKKNKEGSSISIIENKKFQHQLYSYLQDCSVNISEVKYTKNSLKKLFLSYYDCNKSIPIFHKKIEKTSVRFGILAGVHSTKIKFGSSNKYFDYLTATDLPPSQRITGGVSLDLIFPRNQKRWSIHNELIYTSYKVAGHYKRIINGNIRELVDTKFQYSYVKINSLPRFTYPVSNKLAVYANLGLSNGFVIKETNYKHKTKISFSNTTTTKEEDAIETTRKMEQGVLFGLGANLNKFSIEMRGEKGSGISGLSLLSSTTTSYYFLLGYTF